MSTKLQPVRGTKDIFGEEYNRFAQIIAKAREISQNFGYEEIITPIFEFTEVFKRTLGEDSDVVGKEMYTFEDRSENSLTLRPEFTAGIARAFISNGMSQNLPLKIFSTGPLFRYERPQKGRQRQFHQVNFEMLGFDTPKADVELISLGSLLLEALGIKNISLEINSLGDKESRDKYRTALVEYFNDYKDKLSEDSQKRLVTNPLRILDSKDEGDKKIVGDAPNLDNYYSANAEDFFAKVKEGLDAVAIKYKHNLRLVRGLDYYGHTAFEFTTNDLGAQNAVLAGGRYDGLISTLGGPQTAAVGFAGGVERLMALSNINNEKQRPVALIPIGPNAEKEADKLAYIIRKEGFYVELSFSGNLSKRMKKADKSNAKAAIIFGDDELNNNIVKYRDFASGQESDVSFDKVIDRIASL